MQPASGGRAILELEAGGAGEVVYRAALHVPGATYRGRARVRLADGRVDLDPWRPEGAPAWLADAARAFLRAEWRARRTEDAEPWPARISRWRAER